MTFKSNRAKTKRRLNLRPPAKPPPESPRVARDPFENLWEATFLGVTLRIGHRTLARLIDALLRGFRHLLDVLAQIYKATLLVAILLAALAVYEPRLIDLLRPVPLHGEGDQSAD